MAPEDQLLVHRGIREEAVKIVLMKGDRRPEQLALSGTVLVCRRGRRRQVHSRVKKRSIDKPESQHEAHRKAKAAKSMFVSDEEEM